MGGTTGTTAISNGDPPCVTDSVSVVVSNGLFGLSPNVANGHNRPGQSIAQ
jgi:hypothetical protein